MLAKGPCGAPAEHCSVIGAVIRPNLGDDNVYFVAICDLYSNWPSPRLDDARFKLIQPAAGPYRWARSCRERLQQNGSGYSITSSACTRNDSGIVRPIAFAVFMLTTSLYLTGNCTGRSATLAPRRMRST